MTNAEEFKSLVAEKVEYILNYSGAGKEAIDSLAKAYRDDKVFDDLADYIRFTYFFCDRLESGDREKYPLCSNSLYAVEQINIWMLMKQVNI